MKKIIISIRMLLLLSSCYSNPEDTKKIEKLEKQVQENNLKQKEFIFEKNKECRSLLEKHSGTLKDVKLISNFYSIKENSCILVTNDVFPNYIKETVNDSYVSDKVKYNYKRINKNGVISYEKGGKYIEKLDNAREGIIILDLLKIKKLKIITAYAKIEGDNIIESKIDLDNGICLNNSKKEECAAFINYYKSLLN